MVKVREERKTVIILREPAAALGDPEFQPRRGMLQYSYYQDLSTAELQALIREGKQWLHEILDEETLRAIFDFAKDHVGKFTVLIGGELPRPLHVYTPDGGKTEWGHEGSLVLVTNSAPNMSAGGIERCTLSPQGTVVPLDEVHPSEAIVPGPPPYPQVLRIFPNIHAFAAQLRERTGTVPEVGPAK